MSEDLYTNRTDRGFTHHLAVPSAYGGGVRVYESSAASGPHVWLKATAPADLNNPTGPTDEATAHLIARNAWLLARQLAATVVHHYQGDARPGEETTAAQDALAGLLTWSPQAVDTLLHKLLTRGFVLVNVGPPAAGPDAASSAPAVPLLVEPEDGSLVAVLGPDGKPETVHQRDDTAAQQDGYDPTDNWFPVDPFDGDGPASWAQLTRNGATVVRLYLDRGAPPGVSVRKEWGVRSNDGEVYHVQAGQGAAEREAALLRAGVPGDPEQLPEPDARPAWRYVMTVPDGAQRELATGWCSRASWSPPPAEPPAG